MNSSEYKENLKRQIEEEKVWVAGENKAPDPAPVLFYLFIIIILFFLLYGFVLLSFLFPLL